MDNMKLLMYVVGTSAYVTRVSMHGQAREPSLVVELEIDDVQKQ